MSDILLAIDPGKATGYAFVDLAHNMVFESGECTFDETCKLLTSMASHYKSTMHIVSESFIINANTVKNTQAPWSLELIGVARWVSRVYTGRDLVLQAPAAAKRFSSDDKLKQLGWHSPGKGHANDAARHLLLRLASTGKLSNAVLTSLVSDGL
jgi:hypothetical protein